MKRAIKTFNDYAFFILIGLSLLVVASQSRALPLTKSEMRKVNKIVWDNPDAYDWDNYKEQGFKKYICDLGPSDSSSDMQSSDDRFIDQMCAKLAKK